MEKGASFLQSTWNFFLEFELFRRVVQRKINKLAMILVMLIFISIVSVNGKSVYERRSYDESELTTPADRLVARCQLTCVKKFLFDKSEKFHVINSLTSVETRCMNTPNCYMCHDFCQTLPQETDLIAKLMCDNVTCVSFDIWCIWLPFLKTFDWQLWRMSIGLLVLFKLYRATYIDL